MRIEHPRPYVTENLRYALNPATVAVIGASRRPTKVGYKVIEGLLKWGYSGTVYPVNPAGGTVQGLTAYASLADVPGPVDLVFIAVPAKGVPAAVEAAAAKHAKVVAVSSSDFKEAGRGDVQDQLTRYCREHQLPLIGPNFLGMGSPHFKFNCGFIPYLPVPGPVGFISQSGANLLAALGASLLRHYGMSFFVGLGNKADVDFSEFILYGGQDEHTRCIAVYIEGLDSPEAFVEACQAVVPRKPVVVIKVGSSRQAKKAAFAHTASENEGMDDVFFDDVFRRAGVIRATIWQDFLDISMALALQPPLRSDRVVMITNGGGSGLLSCEHFDRLGMPLRPLAAMAPGLGARLRADLPGFGSVLNPVDIAGTASPSAYERALTAAFEDPAVDCVYGSVCPSAITNVPAIADVAMKMHELYRHLGKVLVMECQGGPECNASIAHLRDHGIPAYPTPEQAVSAIVALRKYGDILGRVSAPERHGQTAEPQDRTTTEV
ncbi:MAG: CoA-binding protein [Gemmatimonadales bacterium]